MWKTCYLPLIIVIDDNGDIFMYIDGVHAAYEDRKGHFGLFLTIDRGSMINQSKKLGIVTTSSTETEIVSTGEHFSKCMWFRYFRMAQGDDVREDILMQDNESSIHIHKNYPC